MVHTGRQIAGQDRYGIGLINTQNNTLMAWRTRLWDDNLQFVGGIQRIYAGAISPDGSYFVVSSGSGGDRPPINDTAVAYSIPNGQGADLVQPLWISRHVRQRLLGCHQCRRGVRRWALQLPGVADCTGSVAGPDQRRIRARAGSGRVRTRRRHRDPRSHRGARSGDGQGARMASGFELLRGQQGDVGDPTRRDLRWRRHDPGRLQRRPDRCLRLHAPARRRPERDHDRLPHPGPCRGVRCRIHGRWSRYSHERGAAGPDRGVRRRPQPVPSGRPDDLGQLERHQRHLGVAQLDVDGVVATAHDLGQSQDPVPRQDLRPQRHQRRQQGDQEDRDVRAHRRDPHDRRSAAHPGSCRR